MRRYFPEHPDVLLLPLVACPSSFIREPRDKQTRGRDYGTQASEPDHEPRDTLGLPVLKFDIRDVEEDRVLDKVFSISSAGIVSGHALRECCSFARQLRIRVCDRVDLVLVQCAPSGLSGANDQGERRAAVDASARPPC